MSERIVARHLHALRNGFPAAAAFPAVTALPSSDIASRGCIGEGSLWVPPARPTASRMPPARSRGFCRGFVVSREANRALVYESALERDLLYILQADRRVIELRDQPPAIAFVRDGRSRRHTLDFLATLADGRRIAYAVKPEARVEKSGIGEVLALLAEQAPHVADRFVLRTERHITKDKAANARLILRCRRDRNEADVAEVRRIAATLNGRTSIQELVAASKLGARGWNAAICLIDEGMLVAVGTGRVDERTLVRSASGVI